MKKALLTLFAAGCLASANAQATIGKYAGEVFFLYNGEHPDTFKIDNDTLMIKNTGSQPMYTTYQVTNKLSGKTIYFNWANSYYIADGTAYDVVPGEMKVINVDNPVPNQKIPENTQVNISVYPKGDFNMMRPLFNSYKADQEYRKNKTTLNRILVLVFDVDGERYEKRIVISNQSTGMVRELKKQNKNAKKK